MTAYMTRSPLQTLTMAQPRRHSKRLAGFDDEGDLIQKDAKRAKITNGATTTTMTNPSTSSSRMTRGAAVKQSTSYDEEDDGFKFTRSRPKRTKVVQNQTEVRPEPVVEDGTEEPVKKAKAEKQRERRRMSFSTPTLTPTTNDAAPKPRRTTRTSAGKIVEPELSVQKSRRKPRESHKGDDGMERVGVGDAMELVGGVEVGTPKTRAKAESHADATKIALPFSDTPVIDRNKALRRKGSMGHRRSSVGFRGRRASSLIEKGESGGFPSITSIG
jgi:kinetochore protein Mis13/DSN1